MASLFFGSASRASTSPRRVCPSLVVVSSSAQESDPQRDDHDEPRVRSRDAGVDMPRQTSARVRMPRHADRYSSRANQRRLAVASLLRPEALVLIARDLLLRWLSRVPCANMMSGRRKARHGARHKSSAWQRRFSMHENRTMPSTARWRLPGPALCHAFAHALHCTAC